MAIKSLRIKTDVDVALKAHNCHGNSRHRIQRGDKRLKVRNEWGGWTHYCSECARTIFRRDMDALEALDSEFTGKKTEEDNS